MDGEHSLRELLRRLEGETIPIDHAIAIALGTAAAIHTFHGEGAPVAGAVSPANLWIDGTGNQRLDRQHGFTVEPGYLAPEVVAGKRIDRRGDVFALGVVIYELVTNRLPFDGSTLVRASQRRAEVPPKLDQILGKALEAAPMDRYQTAVAMRSALDQLPRSSASALAGYIKKQFGPRLPEIAPVPMHVIRTRTEPIAAIEWPAPPPSVAKPDVARAVEMIAPAPIVARTSTATHVASDGVPQPMRGGAKLQTARIPALERAALESEGVVRRIATATQSARVAMIPGEPIAKRRTRTVQIPALAHPVPPPQKRADTDDGWSDDLDRWLAPDQSVVHTAKPPRFAESSSMMEPAKPAVKPPPTPPPPVKPARLIDLMSEAIKPAKAATPPRGVDLPGVATVDEPATSVEAPPVLAAPATTTSAPAAPTRAKPAAAHRKPDPKPEYVPSELSAGWTDGTEAFVIATKPAATSQSNKASAETPARSNDSADKASEPVAVSRPVAQVASGELAVRGEVNELAELIESDVDLGDLADSVIVSDAVVVDKTKPEPQVIKPAEATDETVLDSAVPVPIQHEASRRRVDAEPDPLGDPPSAPLRRLAEIHAPGRVVASSPAPAPRPPTPATSSSAPAAISSAATTPASVPMSSSSAPAAISSATTTPASVPMPSSSAPAAISSAATTPASAPEPSSPACPVSSPAPAASPEPTPSTPRIVEPANAETQPSPTSPMVATDTPPATLRPAAVLVRTRSGDVTPSGELIARSHAHELSANAAVRPRRRWVAAATSIGATLALGAAILVARGGEPATVPPLDVPPVMMTAAEPPPSPPKLTVQKKAVVQPVARPTPLPVAVPRPVAVAPRPVAVAPRPVAAKPAAIKPQPPKPSKLWDPEMLFPNRMNSGAK